MTFVYDEALHLAGVRLVSPCPKGGNCEELSAKYHRFRPHSLGTIVHLSFAYVAKRRYHAFLIA